MGALWTAAEAAAAAGGGAQQSAQVRFRAPSERPLGGEHIVSDFMIRYPEGTFPGLCRLEQLTVGGVNYIVREGPFTMNDGSELAVKLEKA